MYATNVRNLKKNPSHALREAEKGPVLVLKGNTPNAVIFHLDSTLANSENELNPALATSLYRDGLLSLGAASRLSGLELGSFIDHLSALGIDITANDEHTETEQDRYRAWHASS